MKIPITGINSSSGQHHSNITSDNTTSVWVDNRQDAWLQLNFGGPTHISEVNVIFDKYEDTVYLFSVGTSTDGLSFTHVRSASNKKGTKLTHVPVNKTAQFVRLTVHENDSPNKYRVAVAYVEAIQNGDKEEKDKTKEKESKKSKTSHQAVKVKEKEKESSQNLTQSPSTYRESYWATPSVSGTETKTSTEIRYEKGK